ncbi:MAG: hypothetical protein ACI4E1_11895 [Lachnospira sp.]
MKRVKKVLGALLCGIMLAAALPVTSKAETVTDKKLLDVQVDNVEKKYMADEDHTILCEFMKYDTVSEKVNVNIYNENSEIYIDYDNSTVSPECVVSDRVMYAEDDVNHYFPYYEADKVGVYMIEALGVKAGRDDNDKLAIQSADKLGVSFTGGFVPVSYYLDFKIIDNKFCINGAYSFMPSNFNKVLPTTLTCDEKIADNVSSGAYCGGFDAHSSVKEFIENNGNTGAVSVEGYDLLIYRYYYATDYQGNENNKWGYTDVYFLPEGQQTAFKLEDKKDEEPQQPEETYTKELAKDAEVISDTDFAAVLAENAAKDVVIKNADGVTFTFAKGTMSAVDGKTAYDFGTNVITDYSKVKDLSSEVTKDNFVLQIDYNYSGQLPAKASITFNVGSDLAGKTLYYYLYNTDKTYKIVQSVVVAQDGSVTVKQDHCSTYVLTNAELVTETPSDDTPATGDSTNYALYIMLAVVSLGAVALVSRKRVSERA